MLGAQAACFSMSTVVPTHQSTCTLAALVPPGSSTAAPRAGLLELCSNTDALISCQYDSVHSYIYCMISSQACLWCVIGNLVPYRPTLSCWHLASSQKGCASDAIYSTADITVDDRRATERGKFCTFRSMLKLNAQQHVAIIGSMPIKPIEEQLQNQLRSVICSA